MKKLQLGIPLLSILLLVLSGCDRQVENITETPSLKGFEKVHLKGDYNVQLKQTDRFHVKLKGPKSVLQKLESEVEKHRLRIGPGQEESIEDYHQTTIVVELPNLTELVLKGSSEATLSSLNTEYLNITTKGTAVINGDVSCKELKITAKGSSNVNLQKLKCQSVAAVAKGASQFKLFASKAAEGTVNGAGTIRFYGNPSSINRDIKGVGQVIVNSEDQD
jgi:hypothetical protein